MDYKGCSIQSPLLKGDETISSLIKQFGVEGGNIVELVGLFDESIVIVDRESVIEHGQYIMNVRPAKMCIRDGAAYGSSLDMFIGANINYAKPPMVSFTKYF